MSDSFKHLLARFDLDGGIISKMHGSGFTWTMGALEAH
jgi:hypothetical protein